MLKLPAYSWGIAYVYGQKIPNTKNSCCILDQWNIRVGIYKAPVCRADQFGGEYAGKGSHNRKRTIKNLNGIAGQQEHYKVLGLAKTATPADIKKAFRQLARQYHPDVNKKPDADDSFKSVRLAYEVLSNEATRYQYDRALRLQELGTNSHWRNWEEFEHYGRRRYSWEGMKQQARRVSWEEQHEASGHSYSSSEDKGFIEERGPVQELLRYAWFTIFCSQILGAQSALTFLTFCAVLNRQMAASYKVAHMVTWLIGGERGIFIILGLAFTSWFCGKASDNFVAVITLALWIGVDLARFVPIPRGAILAMTYFCYKLQLELS